MKHELKILPPYYEAVISGNKTFEIRLDDRGFQKGDKVILREINKGITLDTYTGRECIATIGYVTSYEQQNGYVVFSLLGVKVKGDD